jgi:uncharacterized protein (TIGR02453 family)
VPGQKPIFTSETFRFFRQLKRHNHKDWMDANRERYQETVVRPFRRLLEVMSPLVLDLDMRFDTVGRPGANFSRINRDIRFAKDKTPYRPQMYLKFPASFGANREGGEFYAALSSDAATAGFRIYAGSKRRESALALLAEPRALQDPKWLARQKKRLGRRYESYWYASEKGQWTRKPGWPASAEDWKAIRGWVVRRKLPLSAATRASFPRELAKIFRDLYPIVRFTSFAD